MKEGLDRKCKRNGLDSSPVQQKEGGCVMRSELHRSQCPAAPAFLFPASSNRPRDMLSHITTCKVNCQSSCWLHLPMISQTFLKPSGVSDSR